MRQRTTKLYKIGVTHGSVKDRLAALQVGSAFLLEVVWVVKTREAYRLEADLHERLSRWRLNGEWFRMEESAALGLGQVLGATIFGQVGDLFTNSPKDDVATLRGLIEEYKGEVEKANKIREDAEKDREKVLDILLLDDETVAEHREPLINPKAQTLANALERCDRVDVLYTTGSHTAVGRPAYVLAKYPDVVWIEHGF